ncbi:MAG: PH domain-containing protein [Chloroflexi bacterium]|nr:PH domain-containing protein [Chloroflexota bacterium]
MNALVGAAGRMKDQDQREFQERVCSDGESIVAAFRTKRDSYVFTDRRFIHEDIKGVTGRKRSLFSVPYDKISAFDVETAGHFDADGELRLWVSGFPETIKYELRSGIDVYLIQALLANLLDK